MWAAISALDDPAVEGQAPGFRRAPRRSRSGPSEASRSRQAKRHIALDGGELEGKRRQRPRQAGEHGRPRSPPRRSWRTPARHARRSAHRGSCRAPRSSASQTWPSQPPAPSAAATKSARGGRDRRIGGVDAAASACPAASPQAASIKRHVVVAARRSRGSARAHSGCGSSATTRAPRRRKLPMRSPTWAPMSKARSPGAQEARVERIHGRVARRHRRSRRRSERLQRAQTPDRASRAAIDASGHVHAPASALAAAPARPSTSAGGAKSSGMPHRPSRCEDAARRRLGGQHRERDGQQVAGGQRQAPPEHAGAISDQRPAHDHAEQRLRPQVPRGRRPGEAAARRATGRPRPPTCRTAGRS